jgi:hypothetical protein
MSHEKVKGEITKVIRPYAPPLMGYVTQRPSTCRSFGLLASASTVGSVTTLSGENSVLYVCFLCSLTTTTTTTTTTTYYMYVDREKNRKR